MPTKIFEDPTANEVYIADGYGNRRIIVFDEDTGKYKRHWGAYGNRPTMTDRSFGRRSNRQDQDLEQSGSSGPP